MQYTVKKPDAAEVQFRSRDDFGVAYNTHEIDAGWSGKTERASEWGRVADLLGVNPAVAADATDPTPPAGASLGQASTRSVASTIWPAVSAAFSTARIQNAARCLTSGLNALPKPNRPLSAKAPKLQGATSNELKIRL